MGKILLSIRVGFRPVVEPWLVRHLIFFFGDQETMALIVQPMARIDEASPNVE